ncbi:MAG: CHRD domain-containing protein [Solirubrobacteraceae bacterium]|jgi:hypothetical protein
MQSKLIITGVLVAVLGVTACGSSKKSTSTTTKTPATTTAATTSTTTTPAEKATTKTATTRKATTKKATTKKATTKRAAAPTPSRTYSVKMTGPAETPPGAPKGTASAVITLKGKTLQACWTFSALKGFTHPTFAHIHKGAKGVSGPIVVPLSTGMTFKTKACVAANAAIIDAIEKSPRNYYVNIHSTKYPGGAVRAQL